MKNEFIAQYIRFYYFWGPSKQNGLENCDFTIYTTVTIIYDPNVLKGLSMLGEHAFLGNCH